MKDCMRVMVLAFAGCLFASVGNAQQTTTLDADGPGNTYEIVNSAFGSGAASEVPDCFHAIRHIREAFDSTLGINVFLFDIHVDSIIDNDRCTNYDRQRNEIKTVSPSTITGAYGELHVYRWKFKMDSLFQASPNFCHLHQIKATGGDDDGAPLMTITPRKYSDTTQPEWLQLIFTPSTGQSGAGTLLQVPLQPLKGQWLSVTERVIYSDDGKYEVTISTLDSTVVMHYANYHLDMYRAGANFHRGKWGIYRSLNSQSYLRDETVAFANFSIVEGEPHTAPLSPDSLVATVASDNQINLNWHQSPSIETNFQIQRSTDGVQWIAAGVTDSGVTHFENGGLASGTKYYYRVRAENWNAYALSDTVSATTTGIPSKVEREGSLVPLKPELFQPYPNPFNPSTTLTYRVSEASLVRIDVYDLLGREIGLLVEEVRPAGTHTVRWNAVDAHGEPLDGGVYFATLKAGSFSSTVKMIVLK